MSMSSSIATKSRLADTGQVKQVMRGKAYYRGKIGRGLVTTSRWPDRCGENKEQKKKNE